MSARRSAAKSRAPRSTRLSRSNLRLLGASAQRCVDLLLRVVHEGLAQLARPLEPLDVAWQDHAARTLSIDLGVVNARRHHTGLAQRFGGADERPAYADDHRVCRAQVLLRALVDRAHA